MISVSFNSSLLFIFKLYYQYKISFNLVFVMQCSNRWFNFALYIYEATRLVKCKKLLENFLFEQFLLELFLSCQLISPQVNSTYSIFYIFATTCSRIPNIFFAHMILFWIFTHSPTFIIIPFLIWVTFSTTKFTYTFAWYMFC